MTNAAFNELMARLEEDEAKSRPYRAQRLKLLLDEYGPGGIRLFYGGPVSHWAFEECRLAYLHGLFLSSILAAQVCLEHMLAGLFRMAGRDDLEGAGFGLLLKTALSESFISEAEFGLFDGLRKVRNPYAHYRAPTSKTSPLRRAIATDRAPDDLLVEDARSAVVALLRLCKRHPFCLPASDERNG